jgi:hypothetical protein
VQKKRCYGKNGNILLDNILKNAYVQLDGDFYLQENDGTNESFTVSSWFEKIKPPSNFFKPNDQNIPKPALQFEPEYCYGYRVK